MISGANQKAISAAGLSFILGTRIPYVPQVICEWRAQHPGQQIPDHQAFTQPWPATTAEKARGIPYRVIYYQYRHDRVRRTLRGIDEQVGNAEKAVAGKVSVKRNRFIKLTGADKSVHRGEAKARALAGIKGYATNLISQTAESSSAPTTSCGASRRRSACPSTTSRAARSTTTPANRSKRT
jgi:hypothetical protein